jgi:hypothetical protein
MNQLFLTLRGYFTRILILIFGPPASVGEPPLVPVVPLSPLRKMGKERGGTAKLKETILDNLDHYFVYLRHMRNVDPDAHDFFSRVGAQIVTTDPVLFDANGPNSLSPWFCKTRPTCGCVLWAADRHEDKFEKDKKVTSARFMYFVKYKKNAAPPSVAACSGKGDIYMLHVFFDDSFKDGSQSKFRGLMEFPVFVRESGDLEFPKIKYSHYHDKIGVRRDEWGLHPGVVSLVTERLAEAKAGTLEPYLQVWDSPQNFMFEQFLTVTAASECSNHMIEIRATDNRGLVARFGIDALRMPDFFRDRIKVLTPSGRVARIFHPVKSHLREGSQGVRMHFRGARQFQWRGYQIEISVPEREHIFIAEMDIGTLDEDSGNFRGNVMKFGPLGLWLEKYRRKQMRRVISR